MPAGPDNPLTGRSRSSLLLGALASCAAIFALLQLWRPLYFLTDDNLSYWFPIYTQMGRQMQAGHAPFTSGYLFGGGYNYLRDLNVIRWHPFTLGPALLADSPAQFWMLDTSAFLLLMFSTAGFVCLAVRLREQFVLRIPDGFILFVTLSWAFSSYVLRIGPSWIDFLGNQSALPWLAWAILDRSLRRGTLLVTLFTVHEILTSFAPMVLSSTLCLTLFALAVARGRGSVLPVSIWGWGTIGALLALSPLLLTILDGFSHSLRRLGLPLVELTNFPIPATTFPFSLLFGNWWELLTRWKGDPELHSFGFPYAQSLLACAAAWCVLPALLSPTPWRMVEKGCLAVMIILALFIIRPPVIAIAMHDLPIFGSMRWPFREALQFLFFFHVFLVLRYSHQRARLQTIAASVGAALFLLPLPFVRPPTFNLLPLDRYYLFTGKGARYWAQVRTLLKPGDEIATAFDWPFWKVNNGEIPYTLLGTANFAEYYRVPCVSGYAPTAPTDQLPIKIMPGYWFGAFREEQLPAVLADRPNLRVLQIVSTHPLKITLSNGTAPPIDLTPCLQAAGVTDSAVPSPAGH